MVRKVIGYTGALMVTLLALPGVAAAADTAAQVVSACCSCCGCR
jgi:hypothetical protein